MYVKIMCKCMQKSCQFVINDITIWKLMNYKKRK